MHGYAGRILRVNLTGQTVKKEEIEQTWIRKFLGGMGFGTWILYNETPKGVDPLSPENKLIAAPGLLTGTGIPTASKTLFMAKSPLTGGFGKASAGASIGPALKKAGYDILVIEGKSEKPVALHINDQDVGFEDAAELWGKDVRETATLLKKRHEGVTTAVIGPAGEHLLRIAGIDCEERQAARTGLGAVMGAKNLKSDNCEGHWKSGIC